MKPKRSVDLFHFILIAALCLPGTTLVLSGFAQRTIAFPGPAPGRFAACAEAGEVRVGNDALGVSWQTTGGFRMAEIRDRRGGSVLTPTGEVFQVVFADGHVVSASALLPAGHPVVRAPRAVDLKGGEATLRNLKHRGEAFRPARQEVVVTFRPVDGLRALRWRVIASDQANYLRQVLELSPSPNRVIREIRWLDQTLANAQTAGSVDGSPVIDGPFFLGCEDPHALNVAAQEMIEIGRWTSNDPGYPEPWPHTWKLESAVLSPGTNRFSFDYASGGHRLDIWRVALLEDGREIAVDSHHGYTGTGKAANVYTLVLPALRPGANYELTATIGTDPDFRLPAGRSLDTSGTLSVMGRRARVTCRLPRNAPVPAGETLAQSFVIGVAPPGQLRRAFLYYVERERAHPYRPFLHYNSWYDIAWDPFALNETNCLEAIAVMGDELVRNRRVRLDAMVFDDGWDDPQTLWDFHSGFPRGFEPLARLCGRYRTRLGVWLSPFGGYGQPRERRLKAGSAQGYETNSTGFSLAGAKYYDAFRGACVRMMRDYGVNHFKFDGIAAGTAAQGGMQYVLDTEAMRRLMLELRREDPAVYINLTTGSWPSPFWLRFADSVWRQGSDMGLSGVGPNQQKWITYRDQETYRNIAGRGPLYPLNSLMTQGVAYSRRGSAGDPTFSSAGFKDDVRAFFASGTSLQELYIQPGKLTPEDWDVLAEAARWARANADVLVDTHWIGGDPGFLDVYGYASWSPRKGIVMLRNPADRRQTYPLELAEALELPPGAPTEFKLRSPWRDQATEPPIFSRAGSPVAVELGPFEVRIFEVSPRRGIAVRRQ